ncbi:hypothetical protein [Lysobacter sp. CA196]|uniref:hypothetical protein n=1 Tax=Lysobacter sp. CA196 TaxID=3455606 RepID=UPI003F8D89DB
MNRFWWMLATLLGFCTACNGSGEKAAHREGSDKTPSARQRELADQTPVAVFETQHYAIATTATSEQTRAIGAAVESLHRAYSEFFAEALATEREWGRLQLRLYRNRSEFVAHNRSMPWAEAYYRAPICHAYYSGIRAAYRADRSRAGGVVRLSARQADRSRGADAGRGLVRACERLAFRSYRVRLLHSRPMV